LLAPLSRPAPAALLPPASWPGREPLRHRGARSQPLRASPAGQRRLPGAGRSSLAVSAVLNRFFPLQRNGGGEEPDEVPQASAVAEAAPAPPGLQQINPPWTFPGFRALARRQTTSRVPVFVMLPLDTVTRDGVLTNTKALSVGFAVRKP
jgi:hypothetical protein